MPAPRPPAPRPVVSVLLLCHNEAVFIRRAIRSVLAQSIDAPVEIILMDDASVDDSAAIVQAEVTAAARTNINLNVVRSKTNLGNAEAFVTALRAARGQFYHVLDSDDFWIDPDKLSRQVALLKAHPALGGVGHRTIVRASGSGSESFHPQQDPLKPVLHLEDLLTGGPYFHTSAMLFRNIFFDPTTGQVAVPPIFHEVRGDMIRLLVHAARGGIFYLPQTMSVYDDHGGGIWTGLDWPGRRGLLDNLYNRLSEHGYLDAMGEPAAANYLATQLTNIAAYAPASLRPVSLYPDQVMTAPRHRLTEISRISGLLDLETQLTALTRAQQYEEALRLAMRFLTAIGYDRNIARASRSRRFCSREIDSHCATIGGLIAAAQKIVLVARDPATPDPATVADGPIVFVVSGMVEDQDGMWDTLREMIALWQGRGRIVILSTEFVSTMGDIQDRVGPEVELLLNTQTGLVEKTGWLIWHLAWQKPSRIFVIPARNDVVIAAGLRRQHAPRIHLVSTYDTGYLPCCQSDALTGYVARRPYDLAWFHQIAPQRELVHLPRLVPATPAPEPLAAGLALVTATACRSSDRLEGQYDYTLPLVVPLLLKAGAQRHIHAGPLSDGMRNRIHKALIRQNMPPEAFVHLPEGGDSDAAFGTTLRAAGATLFLQGFPFPETAPLFSAMAAGLPVLAHQNYLHPALSLFDLCPPGTPQWANSEQLVARVGGITPDWIAARSAVTCAHVGARLSAKALLTTLGDSFMTPVAAAEVPDMRVPDHPQSLRHLLSDLMEITVFQP